MKTSKFNAVVLLLSDARGIYIPHDFVQSFDLNKWGLYKDCEAILSNPENEFYWEEWNTVLDNAKLIDEEGNEFRLHHDGDLWALCYDRMSSEEKKNFGFDKD